MARYTYFSEKQNCLFIHSNQLLPNTSGLSWKEHSRAYKQAFAMSYEERLKKFANEECQKEVKEELKKHKGCSISEFMNA